MARARPHVTAERQLDAALLAFDHAGTDQDGRRLVSGDTPLFELLIRCDRLVTAVLRRLASSDVW